VDNIDDNEQLDYVANKLDYSIQKLLMITDSLTVLGRNFLASCEILDKMNKENIKAMKEAAKYEKP
jgi:hypothetical protein